MNRFASVLAIVLVVAFALTALYRLLLLEYDYGDGYPDYSSYRSDPLGTLVLFDALQRARDESPERSIEPLDHAKFSPQSTLLMAGAGISEDEVSTIERIEHFVHDGGRCVILFRADQQGSALNFAEAAREERNKEREAERKKKLNENKDADPKDAGTQTDDETDDEAAEDEMLNALLPRADISERWGFGYRVSEFKKDDANDNTTSVKRAETASMLLPERLPWHSTVAFTDLAPEWTPVYLRENHAVVMEREWGKGRIVLATDSYLLSNEAMLSDRRTPYLTWLLPSDRPVIFEETHLGVSLDAGAMTLARRYGLMPMLGAAVLIVLLFIWRNAVSLVPKRRTICEGTAVTAGSAVAGLASLARRAIRRGDLLEECWKLSQTPAVRRAPIDEARRARIEAELSRYRATPPRRRDPVEAYNHVTAIIQERKTRP